MIFFDAVRAGDLVTIREILSSQVDERGHAAVAVDYIHKAMFFAAEAGNVDACRLLWGKLSRRAKRIYFPAPICTFISPLHVAVNSGHLAVVCLFIEEFKWNINQTDDLGRTPLCDTGNLETARYLLENGANVNQGGPYGYGPLWNAVSSSNTELARLLLVEYHANPNLNRRPPDEEDSNQQHQQQNRRCTDHAILFGNAEILRILLNHGAFVGHLINTTTVPHATSLNVLLCNQQQSLETKLSITRMLVEHALEDRAAAEFIKASFQFEVTRMNDDNNEACRILLDAGIDPRLSMYCAIRAGNLYICQLLVQVYRVDPLLQQQQHDNENDDDGDETDAASPFLAAARLPDTTLFEFFLGVWEERFSASGGKNSDGDYPIHVVCCDPLVSLQATKVLVNHHADALALVDDEQGLLLLHFAANWGASLDVIYYLLQHCRDALHHHVGNTTRVPTQKDSLSMVVETSNHHNDNNNHTG